MSEWMHGVTHPAPVFTLLADTFDVTEFAMELLAENGVVGLLLGETIRTSGSIAAPKG